MYNINDLNTCVGLCTDKINNIIDNSTTFININSKSKCIQEWMTPSLLGSLRHKNELSKAIKNHPNNIYLISHYTKYKKMFTRILKSSKIEFYEKKFADVSFSPK